MTKEFVSTRPAEADDAPVIAAMYRQLATERNYPRFFSGISEDRVRQTVAGELPHESFFVADDFFEDGYGDQVEEFRETAGFIHLGRAPLSLAGRRGLYVDNLYVRPDLRNGHDIGMSLLARAAWIAIELADGNSDRAFLRVDTANNNNDPTLRHGFDTTNTNLRLHGGALKDLANRAILTE
jgi:hypothetical protein